LSQKLPISYFIGAGFVLKKEIYKKFFFENFFYGQEEIDLSYRLIKNGYKMEYNPKLVVFHYRDVRGRLPSNQVIFNNFYHKMILNYKYIPFSISIISNILWFLKTWKDSRSLSLSTEVVKKFYVNKNKFKKKTLKIKDLLQIFFTNGRLFY
jgi:GT2 family glycosyltransferase